MDINNSSGRHPISGQLLQNQNLPTPSTYTGPPATQAHLVDQKNEDLEIEALYSNIISDQILSTPSPEPMEFDSRALRGEDDD